MTNLKQTLTEAAEYYERHAEHYRNRANRATAGSNIQHELLESSKYCKGKAKGLREALEYIDEFLG